MNTSEFGSKGIIIGRPYLPSVNAGEFSASEHIRQGYIQNTRGRMKRVAELIRNELERNFSSDDVAFGRFKNECMHTNEPALVRLFLSLPKQDDSDYENALDDGKSILELDSLVDSIHRTIAWVHENADGPVCVL